MVYPNSRAHHLQQQNQEMGWSTVSDLFRRWNHKSYGVDQESVGRKACKVFIIHAMLFMYGEVDYSNPNTSLRMKRNSKMNRTTTFKDTYWQLKVLFHVEKPAMAIPVRYARYALLELLGMMRRRDVFAPRANSSWTSEVSLFVMGQWGYPYIIHFRLGVSHGNQPWPASLGLGTHRSDFTSWDPAPLGTKGATAAAASQGAVVSLGRWGEFCFWPRRRKFRWKIMGMELDIIFGGCCGILNMQNVGFMMGL